MSGCGGHAGLATELRALVLMALDRLEPLLTRPRPEPFAATGAQPPCAVCPVCAVLAAVRGERPELAVRLAEQAAGLLAVLRAALDEGAGGASEAPAPGGAPPGPGAGGRTVQRIPVERP